MPRRCVYGTCNSDERYPKRSGEVVFFAFPKPKTQLERCRIWIEQCGRPHQQLNPSKITKNYHVCSKHFVNGRPTPEFPDPVAAVPNQREHHGGCRKPLTKRSRCDEPSAEKPSASNFNEDSHHSVTDNDLPQHHGCKKAEVLGDQQLFKWKMNSGLDQQEPEPPPIKEESEELSISQEGELQLKEETTDMEVWCKSNCDEIPQNFENAGVHNEMEMHRRCGPQDAANEFHISADPPKLHACNEVVVFAEPQKNFSPDLEEPQPRHIKQEDDVIVKCEENVVQYKEEMDHQHRLLDATRIPVIPLHRVDYVRKAPLTAASLLADMMRGHSDVEDSENLPDVTVEVAPTATTGRPDLIEDAEAGQSYLLEFLEAGETFQLYDVTGREDDATVTENDPTHIPSEEDETYEDEQIESPVFADEPPKKKPRVNTSQPKASEQPSASNDFKIPSLGVPCDADRCAKKCTLNISINKRNAIFDAYWSMNRHERKIWVFNSVCKGLKSRDTTGGGHISRRKMTYSYRLEAEDGKSHEVCKTFFIATLGYHHKNDRFITTAVQSGSLDSVEPPRDRRGRHVPANKMDTNPIKAHIESFGPNISHYRCGHAPRRRYLPSDITIKFMYQDFRDKNLDSKCSYETFRKVVHELNISFTKPGEEECEKCVQIHPLLA